MASAAEKKQNRKSQQMSLSHGVTKCFKHLKKPEPALEGVNRIKKCFNREPCGTKKCLGKGRTTTVVVHVVAAKGSGKEAQASKDFDKEPCVFKEVQRIAEAAKGPAKEAQASKVSAETSAQSEPASQCAEKANPLPDKGLIAKTVVEIAAVETVEDGAVEEAAAKLKDLSIDQEAAAKLKDLSIEDPGQGPTETGEEAWLTRAGAASFGLHLKKMELEHWVKHFEDKDLTDTKQWFRLTSDDLKEHVPGADVGERQRFVSYVQKGSAP